MSADHHCRKRRKQSHSFSKQFFDQFESSLFANVVRKLADQDESFFEKLSLSIDDEIQDIDRNFIELLDKSGIVESNIDDRVYDCLEIFQNSLAVHQKEKISENFIGYFEIFIQRYCYQIIKDFESFFSILDSISLDIFNKEGVFISIGTMHALFLHALNESGSEISEYINILKKSFHYTSSKCKVSNNKFHRALLSPYVFIKLNKFHDCLVQIISSMESEDSDLGIVNEIFNIITYIVANKSNSKTDVLKFLFVLSDNYTESMYFNLLKHIIQEIIRRDSCPFNSAIKHFVDKFCKDLLESFEYTKILSLFDLIICEKSEIAKELVDMIPKFLPDIEPSKCAFDELIILLRIVKMCRLESNSELTQSIKYSISNYPNELISELSSEFMNYIDFILQYEDLLIFFVKLCIKKDFGQILYRIISRFNAKYDISVNNEQPLDKTQIHIPIQVIIKYFIDKLSNQGILIEFTKFLHITDSFKIYNSQKSIIELESFVNMNNLQVYELPILSAIIRTGCSDKAVESIGSFIFTDFTDSIYYDQLLLEQIFTERLLKIQPKIIFCLKTSTKINLLDNIINMFSDEQPILIIFNSLKKIYENINNYHFTRDLFSVVDDFISDIATKLNFHDKSDYEDLVSNFMFSIIVDSNSILSKHIISAIKENLNSFPHFYFAFFEKLSNLHSYNCKESCKFSEKLVNIVSKISDNLTEIFSETASKLTVRSLLDYLINMLQNKKKFIEEGNPDAMRQKSLAYSVKQYYIILTALLKIDNSSISISEALVLKNFIDFKDTVTAKALISLLHLSDPQCLGTINYHFLLELIDCIKRSKPLELGCPPDIASNATGSDLLSSLFESQVSKITLNSTNNSFSFPVCIQKFPAKLIEIMFVKNIDTINSSNDKIKYRLLASSLKLLENIDLKDSMFISQYVQLSNEYLKEIFSREFNPKLVPTLYQIIETMFILFENLFEIFGTPNSFLNAFINILLKAVIDDCAHYSFIISKIYSNAYIKKTILESDNLLADICHIFIQLVRKDLNICGNACTIEMFMLFISNKFKIPSTFNDCFSVEDNYESISAWKDIFLPFIQIGNLNISISKDPKTFLIYLMLSVSLYHHIDIKSQFDITNFICKNFNRLINQFNLQEESIMIIMSFLTEKIHYISLHKEQSDELKMFLNAMCFPVEVYELPTELLYQSKIFDLMIVFKQVGSPLLKNMPNDLLNMISFKDNRINCQDFDLRLRSLNDFTQKVPFTELNKEEVGFMFFAIRSNLLISETALFNSTLNLLQRLLEFHHKDLMSHIIGLVLKIMDSSTSEAIQIALNILKIISRDNSIDKYNMDFLKDLNNLDFFNSMLSLQISDRLKSLINLKNVLQKEECKSNGLIVKFFVPIMTNILDEQLTNSKFLNLISDVFTELFTIMNSKKIKSLIKYHLNKITKMEARNSVSFSTKIVKFFLRYVESTNTSNSNNKNVKSILDLVTKSLETIKRFSMYDDHLRPQFPMLADIISSLTLPIFKIMTQSTGDIEYRDAFIQEMFISVSILLKSRKNNARELAIKILKKFISYLTNNNLTDFIQLLMCHLNQGFYVFILKYAIFCMLTKLALLNQKEPGSKSEHMHTIVCKTIHYYNEELKKEFKVSNKVKEDLIELKQYSVDKVYLLIASNLSTPYVCKFINDFDAKLKAGKYQESLILKCLNRIGLGLQSNMNASRVDMLTFIYQSLEHDNHKHVKILLLKMLNHSLKKVKDDDIACDDSLIGPFLPKLIKIIDDSHTEDNLKLLSLSCLKLIVPRANVKQKFLENRTLYSQILFKSLHTHMNNPELSEKFIMLIVELISDQIIDTDDIYINSLLIYLKMLISHSKFTTLTVKIFYCILNLKKQTNIINSGDFSEIIQAFISHYMDITSSNNGNNVGKKAKLLINKSLIVFLANNQDKKNCHDIIMKLTSNIGSSNENSLRGSIDILSMLIPELSKSYIDKNCKIFFVNLVTKLIPKEKHLDVFNMVYLTLKLLFVNISQSQQQSLTDFSMNLFEGKDLNLNIISYSVAIILSSVLNNKVALKYLLKDALPSIEKHLNSNTKSRIPLILTDESDFSMLYSNLMVISFLSRVSKCEQILGKLVNCWITIVEACFKQQLSSSLKQPIYESAKLFLQVQVPLSSQSVKDIVQTTFGVLKTILNASQSVPDDLKEFIVNCLMKYFDAGGVCEIYLGNMNEIFMDGNVKNSNNTASKSFVIDLIRQILTASVNNSSIHNSQLYNAEENIERLLYPIIFESNLKQSTLLTECESILSVAEKVVSREQLIKLRIHITKQIRENRQKRAINKSKQAIKDPLKFASKKIEKSKTCSKVKPTIMYIK